MQSSSRRLAAGFGAIVMLLLMSLGTAMAATKLALVLGNSQYQNAPALENPAKDAQDLAGALRGMGFEVIEQQDASRDAMAKAVHDFADRLPGAEVALFFYAGHGLQMNGENYLVPVDAKIQSPADVRFNTINLSDIQQEMESTGRTNIIILDACRDNPFADKLAQAGRSIGGRGLLRVDAGAPGSLIVYSTQPNNIALDGTGRNSPFTAALLKHVATPGLEVRQMISRVRGDVLAATDNRQTPWDSSSLVGDVYLASGPAAVAQAAPVAAPAVGIAASAPRQAVAAAPGVEDECDKIAAFRMSFTTAAAVHETAETDWNRGVAVCEAAVRAHPGEPRFMYELGRAQDHLKNYVEALRDFRTAVDAGSNEALVDLSLLYYQGHGVVQSYPTAFEYMSKAAAAGSVRALANVASMYGNGFGVKKDDAKALDLAEKAIEEGNPFGLQIIANHYFNGWGVPRDYKMAGQYLQQAADLGDGRSMKFLANMYESGYLGPPDPAKASELRLRAEQVDPGSSDPVPARLPMLRQTVAAAPAVHRRRYVIYRPNPLWSGVPTGAGCCPAAMLVCFPPMRWCGR